MMVKAAKAELIEALRARDKGAMSLEELKLCAEILRTLSEVSDSSRMDVLSEAMKFMAESMKDAAAPFTSPTGETGLALAI